MGRLLYIALLFGGFAVTVLALVFKPVASEQGIFAQSIPHYLSSQPSTTELVVRNTVLMGLVFIVVPFLPSCGLFLDVGFTVAERILYMPRYWTAHCCHVQCDMYCNSLGYCLLLGWLAYKMSGLVGGSGSGRTIVFLSIVVLISGAYSARTVLRNEGEVEVNTCVT